MRYKLGVSTTFLFFQEGRRGVSGLVSAFLADSRRFLYPCMNYRVA